MTISGFGEGGFGVSECGLGVERVGSLVGGEGGDEEGEKSGGKGGCGREGKGTKGKRVGNTCLVVEFGVVEALDDLGDGLEGAVPGMGSHVSSVRR